LLAGDLLFSKFFSDFLSNFLPLAARVTLQKHLLLDREVAIVFGDVYCLFILIYGLSFGFSDFSLDFRAVSLFEENVGPVVLVGPFLEFFEAFRFLKRAVVTAYIRKHYFS
jgi:hypothetical protein